MIYRLIFNRAGNDKKKNILNTKGVNIGCFSRGEKKVFVFLLDDFFVEAYFDNDDVDNELLEAKSFTDYRRLEGYLERSVSDTRLSS